MYLQKRIGGIILKATNRNERSDRAGKHNDRNFDLSRAPHINKDLSHLNKYYTYNGDYTHTFEEVEKEFYNKEFGEYLEARNKRCVDCGHPARKIGMDKYRRSYLSRPEDKILQIGNMYNHVDGEELWQCALEYIKRFDELYGDHCKIVDAALHLDEEEMTPHVHIRRVWIGEDDYGHRCVGQNKALKAMGFERPDLSMPEGKYNHAKMPFSDMEREMFNDICKERGHIIDVSSRRKGEKHYSKKEFAERELVSKKFENLKSDLEKYKENTPVAYKMLDDYSDMLSFFLTRDTENMRRIKEAKDKEYQERKAILDEIYNKTLKKVFDEYGKDLKLDVLKKVVNKDISLRQIKDFVKREGLEKKYEKFFEKPTEKER